MTPSVQGIFVRGAAFGDVSRAARLGQHSRPRDASYFALWANNENNQFGAKLPEIDWNIGKDIDEMNMPTDYDPDLYGDEDDDD